MGAHRNQKFPTKIAEFLAAKSLPLVGIAMAMPPHASDFSLKNQQFYHRKLG